MNSNNIWTEEDKKILDIVLEEWFSEFLSIFKKLKKEEVENFIFYSKCSFIYHNVFFKEYQLIQNHPNWNEWEHLVKQFYLKKCSSRRLSVPFLPIPPYLPNPK